jgi:hypothetical protein
VRPRSESECASAPIGRTAHTHAPDNPVSAPPAQTLDDLIVGRRTANPDDYEAGSCVACGTITGRRHLDVWHCPRCANTPTEETP